MTHYPFSVLHCKNGSFALHPTTLSPNYREDKALLQSLDPGDMDPLAVDSSTAPPQPRRPAFASEPSPDLLRFIGEVAQGGCTRTFPS